MKLLSILIFVFPDVTLANMSFAFEGKPCPGLTCEGIIHDSLLGINAARGPVHQSPLDIAGKHDDIVSGHIQLSWIIQRGMLVVMALVALMLTWKIFSYTRKEHSGQMYFNRADSGPEDQQPLITSTDTTIHMDQECFDETEPYGFPGLLLRSTIICLPCVGAGYNLTVIGASLPSLAVVYDLDAALEGVVVSVYCGGCIVGAVMTSRLADDFGRKYILILSTLLLLLAHLIMIVSMHLGVFLLGRSLVGISSGLATTLAPMYIAELVPRARRGFLVSMQEQSASMGLLFGFAAASMQDASFRHHALLGAIVPVLALGLMPLVAESPRWLIGRHRFEEAGKIMRQYVADHDEVTQSLRACQSNTCQTTNKERRIGTVFSALVGCPAARRRLAMASAIMALEEFVGMETSDAFCIQFLIEGGLEQALVAALLIGMVIVKGVVLLASGVFLDSRGRKPALYVSFGGMFLSLLGCSWAFASGKPAMLALAWLLFNFTYAAGLGCVCPVLCSESFPDQHTRGVGIALTYILNRLVGALAQGTYPVLHQDIGVSNIFLVWAAASFVGLNFTYFCMVETRGRVLEDC